MRKRPAPLTRKRVGTLRRAGACLGRGFGAVLLSLGLVGSALAAGPVCQPKAWPQWDGLLRDFIQPDGRLIDASTPVEHSSSEGQSYGMFFALVAGDEQTFDRLWRWSVDNLAAGDITKHLPAWYWGKRMDGSWGVIDDNSASDADLWFTYDLLQGARVWHRDDYARDARALLANIESQEVVQVPGLGAMLVPGAHGFVESDRWRFNPSYLPLPVLRQLAQTSPRGPWAEIARNTVKLMQQTSPLGFAPDWVGYQVFGKGGRFTDDPVKGATGSYDAIRTYLWAGMTSSDDPLARSLLAALGGMTQAVLASGSPPEHVQTNTGVTTGTGPFGFSAALLPYFRATKQQALLDSQLARVQTDWAASLSTEKQHQPPYYDYMLSLFGTGWLDGRYRFGRDGDIQLQWEKSCR